MKTSAGLDRLTSATLDSDPFFTVGVVALHPRELTMRLSQLSMWLIAARSVVIRMDQPTGK